MGLSQSLHARFSSTDGVVGDNQGHPQPQTGQVVAQHLHQHGKMVKLPFPPQNIHTSAIWTTQKQQFSASWTHQDLWGGGANRPSRRQAHADASHKRRQPCRRTPGQRPKPRKRQDDHHDQQQRDEGGLLWCNLAAQTSSQPPGRTRKGEVK
eukprot:SAG31_NODE_16883_length_691_cov_3.033784_1_plen_151_part_10